MFNKKIPSFDGEYRWLSNFHSVPRLFMDGMQFTSVEHAYQAAKTLDMKVREEFLYGTARRAKGLGRRVLCRDNWESIKEGIMLDLLRQKFSMENPELLVKLLATGQAELVEGNTWNDTYWGVCNGVGKNRLGILIMRVRSERQNS